MFYLSLWRTAATWGGFWPNHRELPRPPFVSGPHPVKDRALADCWPQWAPGEVFWGYGRWSRQGDPPHRALLLEPAQHSLLGGGLARLLRLSQEDWADSSDSSYYHRRRMSQALAVWPSAGPRIDWVIWCVAEARANLPSLLGHKKCGFSRHTVWGGTKAQENMPHRPHRDYTHTCFQVFNDSRMGNGKRASVDFQEGVPRPVPRIASNFPNC